MKIITKDKLGNYAGRSDVEMPTNGDVFIYARSDVPKLMTCCSNCGDYSSVSIELAREFLAYVKSKTCKP